MPTGALEARLVTLAIRGWGNTAGVPGRITLHGKARSVQEKANDTNEIK